MLSRQLVTRCGMGIRPALINQVSMGCGGVCFTGLRCEKRGVSQIAANLATHALQVPSCFSLSTLLYSPLGTAMLIVLAYNMVVVGTKQMTYIMEITGKDYVQDQQLHQIMKYGILSCLLLAMEVLFVEV